jgi:hypothetical protein
MSFGYIYLKKDLNADGSVRAYCFGKTSRTQKRDQAYRKENPFIKHMASYSASDMHAAEEELKAVVRSEGMALVDNSDEWIRPECIQRFKPIWHRVAEKYKAKTPQTKSKVDLEREAIRQRKQQLAEKAKRAEVLRRQEKKAERAKKKAENAKKVEETLREWKKKQAKWKREEEYRNSPAGQAEELERFRQKNIEIREMAKQRAKKKQEAAEKKFNDGLKLIVVYGGGSIAVFCALGTFMDWLCNL